MTRLAATDELSKISVYSMCRYIRAENGVKRRVSVQYWGTEVGEWGGGREEGLKPTFVHKKHTLALTFCRIDP